MDFSFATPVPNTAWRSRYDAVDEEDAKSKFDVWMSQTAKTVPSPAFKATGQTTDNGQECSQDNVAVLDQGDRYEGHTADVLFTRWLENTEAALSPAPTEPASGSKTPATLSRFTGSPAADIMALQGHPLSMKRAADAACNSALGTAWYGASPIPSQPAFAAWRDSSTSEAYSPAEHSDGEDAEDDTNMPAARQTPQNGRSKLWRTNAPTAQTPGATDYEMNSVIDIMSQLGVGDMQVSPAPRIAGAGADNIPATPETQVLELMVSPAPRSRLQQSSYANDDANGYGAGLSTKLSWGSDDEHEGDSADNNNNNDDDDDSGDEMDEQELDLKGLGFTPQPKSPLQELLQLMMTPVTRDQYDNLRQQLDL